MAEARWTACRCQVHAVKSTTSSRNTRVYRPHPSFSSGHRLSRNSPSLTFNSNPVSQGNLKILQFVISPRRHRKAHVATSTPGFVAAPNLERQVLKCNGARPGARRSVEVVGAVASATPATAATGGKGSRKEVQSPPPNFDFRAETRADTLAVVSSTYPELLDLVEDGTLLVVKRSEHQLERRVDGYREPEMVFVMGTAHISLLSAEQVRRVVRRIRPENVVVELCRSRAGIMYNDTPSTSIGDNSDSMRRPTNLMSLSGENFLTAMSRTLKLGGRSALGLRLLLGGMSWRISKAAGGMATGAEFRSAREAAEEVGAQIVLGDRPIEVTLERAWRELKWVEKVRLAGIFARAMVSKDLDVANSQETLRRALSNSPDDDVLSAMFSEMGKRLPSLLQPLIYERDMYLAWSLRRSKAVNGCSRVVGVVGRGHMRGVVYNLMHNQQNLRFKDLVGDRGETKGKQRRTESLKLVRNLIVETFVGGALWLLWEHFHQN